MTTLVPPTYTHTHYTLTCSHYTGVSNIYMYNVVHRCIHFTDLLYIQVWTGRCSVTPVYTMLRIGCHSFMTSTRRGRVVRFRWMHADWGRGVNSMWKFTQKIFKLEPTDIILSSSHAKKLVFFVPEFRLWTE